MIISHSRRFIFVHVHKCAGSTIASHLSRYTRRDDIELGVTEHGERTQVAFRERVGLWKHSRAVEIQSVMGDAAFRKYFRFGFVRNPFYRLVSYYSFIAKLHRTSSGDQLTAIAQWPISAAYRESTSFSAFLRHPKLVEPPMFRLLTTAPERPWRLLVDFVGKVETFRQDLSYVCSRVGIPERENITRANVSQHSPTRLRDHYASEDDLHFAYEKWRYDFDIFNYSLDEGLALFRAGR